MSNPSSPRWIAASPAVLTKITEARELQKNKQIKRNPGFLSSASSLEKFPSFINILHDRYFKGQTDTILKQFWCVESSSKVPPQLKGLRIPELMGERCLPVKLVVYRMSNSAALKYGLRLTPRQRYRSEKIRKTNILSTGQNEPCLELADPCLAVSYPSIQAHLKSKQIYNDKPLSALSCNIPMTDVEMDVEQERILEPAWVPYSAKLLLDKNRILYCGQHRSSFPEDSPLKAIMTGSLSIETAAIEIMRSIIQTSVHSDARDACHSNIVEPMDNLEKSGQLRGMTLALGKLVKFHKRKPCIREFVRQCTLPWIVRKKRFPSRLETSFSRNPSDGQNQNAKVAFFASKLSEAVPHSAVIGGLNRILYISGCTQLLGSKANVKSFLRFLRKYILAGTNSALFLGQLIGMLKLEHCRWLREIKSSIMRSHIFAKTVLWVFSHYILNILKTGFYVTEATLTRYQYNFYFWKTWMSISDTKRNLLMGAGKLRKIHSLGNETPNPTAKFRFLPKKDNLRTILGLGLKNRLRSVELINICAVARHLAFSWAPHATINERDISRMWKKFLREWRKTGQHKLFFLRADIRNAYSSVDVAKLRRILQEDVDMTKHYSIQESRLHFSKRITRKVVVRITHTFKPEQRPDRWERKLNIREILHKIIEIMLSRDVVKSGSKYYHFADGLPHGSSISQSLCNIYYGHMEQKYLGDFIGCPGELFIRSVDDYFFISPDPNRVASLYKLIRKGFPEYNYHIKCEKTCTNIYVSSDLEVGCDEWVKFCGWRFNVINGHVTRNFSPYAGIDPCSTITFAMGNADSPEDFIHNLIGRIFPLRMNFLTLEPEFNCKVRIVKTVYEAALMMAFRFFASLRVLYPTHAIPLNDEKIAIALCRSISAFAKCIYIRVRRLTQEMYQYDGHNCNCHSPGKKLNLKFLKLPFVESEIRYIVYRAFLMKLWMHTTGVYKATGGLVRKLELLLQDLEKTLQKPRFQYLECIRKKKMPEHFLNFRAPRVRS